MSIVGQTRKFVTTQILSQVKPKHHQLFSFGLQSLTLTPYESLGSNARLIIKNICTASSKIYRLVSNKTVVDNFPKLVARSGLVQKTSLVNVDFSTFCGFQALVFAVQTAAGRALPVWNNAITYPIETVGSQNLFVLEEIKGFGKTLGFYPRFVFDRGFWIPIVMKYLLTNKIHFYLRIKQGQTLVWRKKGRKRTAKTIGTYTKDATISLFGVSSAVVSVRTTTKTDKPKEETEHRALVYSYQRYGPTT